MNAALLAATFLTARPSMRSNSTGTAAAFASTLFASICQRASISINCSSVNRKSPSFGAALASPLAGGGARSFEAPSPFLELASPPFDGGLLAPPFLELVPAAPACGEEVLPGAAAGGFPGDDA